MKKAVIFTIIACMLLSSCSNTGTNDNNTNNETKPAGETQSNAESTETEAETEPDENARLSIDDELPENDFGGRNFTVFCASDNNTAQYLVADEITGEGVNDAIYYRNLTVDERYNAKVAYNEGGTHRETAALVDTIITSGDTESFDLVQFHVVSNSGNAMKGLYLNWYDVPHIDFEKPWWSDSNIEDLTINNHSYLAMGDFALTTIAGTYCMFYDKDQCKNYGVENLYDVVKDGRWTLDYLKELCGKVYTDLNGDGTINEGDYFGMASDQQSNLNTYLWSSGHKIFNRNSAGELEYSYYDEHLVNVYDSAYELINGTDGVYTAYDHDSGAKLFAEGGTLTCNTKLGYAVTGLSDFENEYGIIPYPKYDEAQASYASMVDGSHEAMAVAKTAQDLEFIGTMTEVLCAESYKQVLPAYYDVCLKQRYASSAEDAEMIDLCVDSRVFDLGYVYDNWKGVAFYFQDLLRNTTKTDITSHYKKYEKVASKYYQKVVGMFE